MLALTLPFRSVLALFLVVSLAAPQLSAQKKKKKPDPEEGMVLEVSTKQKKKKGDVEITQTLPVAKEAPGAVAAETDRLFFQVSPLSAKGLLSQQTRDAMRALLRSSHGTGIVKLRAFVAGSGDMRRIQEIAGEVFGEKHLPLPALTVIQAGALPMEGAQVVIEGIGVEKKPVNPNGVAFISGQQAGTVEQSLDRMKIAVKAGGMDGGDVLTLTCFVSSLEESRNGRALAEGAFPGAALDFVQMQRLPVVPGAECEGVARLRGDADIKVILLNPLELAPPVASQKPLYSQMALVRTPKVVLSGMQMGFGREEADVKLAFDRLAKVLSGVGVSLDRVAMSHIYLTSMTLADKVRAVRKGFYNADMPPASTLLPFEGLPSLDATFGIDVVVPQN